MLSQRLKTAIEAHAADVYPNECCGLITRVGRQRRYIRCENSHEMPTEHFRIAAGDWIAAEDTGDSRDGEGIGS
ncbi:Mov34/MPN/PAD-1 family protein [Klebsiella variicola]|uniref:Mov34/MPN/PAD-1 family protein n=1 Tax=Klebsiella variicola TaxID=244366 RepID=UPI0021C287F9|nr:Mov34/MPN/PAD-1 family protein [Klebsiella variicola]